MDYSKNAGQLSPQKESALQRLSTKLNNAVNPALSATKEIEEKLHAILNLNYPQNKNDQAETVDSKEFRNGGIVAELEEQILLAHEVTSRLEKILKHLSEII